MKVGETGKWRNFLDFSVRYDSKAIQKGKSLDVYDPIGTRHWQLSEIPTTGKLPGS